MTTVFNRRPYSTIRLSNLKVYRSSLKLNLSRVSVTLYLNQFTAQLMSKYTILFYSYHPSFNLYILDNLKFFISSIDTFFHNLTLNTLYPMHHLKTFIMKI